MEYHCPWSWVRESGGKAPTSCISEERRAFGGGSRGLICLCCLRKCVCVCMCVAHSCLTLCDPMDCNVPGSSVHRISQAR